MKVCSIEGCEKKLLARGWCSKHYQRWKSHGDALAEVNVHYDTPEEAFAARTEWRNGCLVWTGHVQDAGYGVIQVKGRNMKAHRYAFIEAFGPVERHIEIDHRCHNKACCNISHLRALGKQQNQENRKGPNAGNTSGHLGVTFDRDCGKWRTYARSGGRRFYGSRYPLYELHVAGYRARELRNKYLTYNDQDRENPIAIT